MRAPTPHDYIRTYEDAVGGLKQNPTDPALQHKAILALARAGSTKLALSEYDRYGLNSVRHHEDIMSLDARLSKDLYLASSGKEALEHARDAAHKYEAAYKDSHGFYSGINAATMALVANMPSEQITDRSRNILDSLPTKENLTSEEHYFIEATRAECFLLLGKLQEARKSLVSAISHDPLNYTAHASTLKQFRMILAHQNLSNDWLSKLTAPQAVHFAGHIFGLEGEDTQAVRSLSKAQIKALKIQISDAIQKHDIGFAYGALAAGSDIVMAEAFLEEGVELNLVLPTSKTDFIEKSVIPFGKGWKTRFTKCFKLAHSVAILSDSETWPSAHENKFCGQFAMGQAILKSQVLSTRVSQLLIWNEKSDGTYTSIHAQDWSKTGRDQIITNLTTSSVKSNKPVLAPSKTDTVICMARSDNDKIEMFETVLDAARKAFKIKTSKSNVQIGLHASNKTSHNEDTSISLANAAFTNGIAASENFASLLALSDEDEFHINYAGSLGNIRAYTLSSRQSI